MTLQYTSPAKFQKIFGHKMSVDWRVLFATKQILYKIDT